MPVLKILSNESFLKTDELLIKTSALLAEILGKPEKYIMVSLEENPDMIFGGTNEPLFYIELKSIGLPRNRTKEISRRLCEFLAEETDIPASRIYIEFSDAEGAMWGWNGSTF
jgi:phenylpyruvate tautomerase PptA (4-oxalocrotonate tautomerase family)